VGEGGGGGEKEKKTKITEGLEIKKGGYVGRVFFGLF